MLRTERTTPSLKLATILAGVLITSMSLDGRCGVIYDGFANTSGLTLNGAATTVSTSDGDVLRLTGAAGDEAGSAFSTDRVSTAEFTSVFSFRITDPGGPIFDGNTSNGADGFVFAVQNVANNVGDNADGIGFRGISPSIGVAFDTWLNPENNDPSQNYVGIDINGNVVHDPSNGPTVTLPPPELGAGDRWWSWVVYDGRALSVYLMASDSTSEPERPAAPILTYDVNLSSLLGQSTAFAGFTSSTGFDWENHDILSWHYTPVPEPSSIVLAALIGLVVIPLLKRTNARPRIGLGEAGRLR